jgi:hypothetical protein
VNVPAVNVPDLNVPAVNLPDVDVPTVKFAGLGDFFRLPADGHIPPGQLKNARFINGVPNPFFGIPPGQLKKMPTVNGIGNPFFDEAPGYWVIPDAPFPPES